MLRFVLPVLATTMTVLTTTRTLALQVSPALQANLPAVYQAPLVPLEFGPLLLGEEENSVVQEASSTVTFAQAAAMHAKKAGSLLFVMRRAG